MGSAIERHKRAMEIIRTAHQGIAGVIAEAEACGTSPDEIGLLRAAADNLHRMLRNGFWVMVVNSATPDETSEADEREAMRRAIEEWQGARL